MVEIVVLIAVAILAFMAGLLVVKRKGGDTPDESRVTKADLELLAERLRGDFSDQVGERLDRNQARVMKTLQNQFSESTRIVSDVSKSITELKETNKQVVGVTDELKTLQNILQNPKQRGVLGEFYLKQVLENVLPPQQFSLQYGFTDGTVVDAVIFLDKGKVLPVDSKFSLENYNRLLEAKDGRQRQEYVREFRSDLKKRIDETSKYVKPEEKTMDFALMFIPSEAIYYDLLINKVGASTEGARDLLEYAFTEKKVMIVSPTSFMAYLQTVLQGLRSLEIEERARDIQAQVGRLQKHIVAYDTFMKKIGSSLGTTVNHFNNAHNELHKIDKDVVKIAGVKKRVEPQKVEKPDS